MTNKEAIKCIKTFICYRQGVCCDGICRSTEENPCSISMAIEALENQDELIEIVARGVWFDDEICIKMDREFCECHCSEDAPDKECVNKWLEWRRK